jgi:hypothetical protein
MVSVSNRNIFFIIDKKQSFAEKLFFQRKKQWFSKHRKTFFLLWIKKKWCFGFFFSWGFEGHPLRWPGVAHEPLSIHNPTKRKADAFS